MRLFSDGDGTFHGPVDSTSEGGLLQLGTLRSIHVRVGKEPAPRPVSCAQAVAGFGLSGDRHASPQSPRQVLVAGVTAYERWGLPPASLRENLLFDFPSVRFRSGDLVRVGEDVVLWMTFLCEPCSLLERRCPGTLTTIGAHRGMLARVVRGGMVRVGDSVAALPERAPEFSNEWQQRVLHVARAVPAGFRIGYRQLAELAGVPTAYCRAFPRVLSSLPEQVARRVGSAEQGGAERPWSGVELFASVKAGSSVRSASTVTAG